MKNLQHATDDVGVIAETVATLNKLLDRFYSQHGQELYMKIEAAWPDAHSIHTAKALFKLERDLVPPDYMQD